MATASDVVQIVVNDDAQVLDVLLASDGVLAGAAEGLIGLGHSTSRPRHLRLAIRAASRSGVTVLDAPVSGASGCASIPEMRGDGRR